MTKNELNRDVKRLYNEYLHYIYQDRETYYNWLIKTAKPELRRLYGADKTLVSLTKDNLLRLLKMNIEIVEIPLHQFGLFIEL